jgi:hypothetical protein
MPQKRQFSASGALPGEFTLRLRAGGARCPRWLDRAQPQLEENHAESKFNATDSYGWRSAYNDTPAEPRGAGKRAGAKRRALVQGIGERLALLRI